MIVMSVMGWRTSNSNSKGRKIIFSRSQRMMEAIEFNDVQGGWNDREYCKERTLTSNSNGKNNFLFSIKRIMEAMKFKNVLGLTSISILRAISCLIL